MRSRLLLGYALTLVLACGAGTQLAADSKLDQIIREAAAKWRAKFEKLEQHLEKKYFDKQKFVSWRNEALKDTDFEWGSEDDPIVVCQRQPRSWWHSIGLPWPSRCGGRPSRDAEKVPAAKPSEKPPAPGPESATRSVQAPKAGKSDTRTMPVTRRNRYIIQLKPDIADLENQLDKLLQKYDLEVVDRLEGLGTIMVRSKKAAGPAAPTRSLEDILQPQIIKDLKSESIVDAAVVDSVLVDTNLPKPSRATSQNGGSAIVWNWQVGAVNDGNWGLKRMRIPGAWRLLMYERKRAAAQPRTPGIAFVDTGFFPHSNLALRFAAGTQPERKLGAACQGDHGTHVAGIVGAAFDTGTGVDGIVPDAEVDAIAYVPQLVFETAKQDSSERARHVTLFGDIVWDIWALVQKRAKETTERQIINVSLAYNWRAVGIERPEDDANIKLLVQEQGRIVKQLADSVKNQFLFVVAAGNDSVPGKPPVNAQWASPFGWAALYWSYLSYVPFVSSPWYNATENIIVVEAFGRDGQRAPFSNDHGHVAAPGVDIMSTSAIAPGTFAVCTGTSQAAPHVTGLAAILMALDSSKTPIEIAKIIKDSAVKPQGGGGAPQVDAIEAIGKLSEAKLKALADLDGDGKVDGKDLEIFKSQMEVLHAARTKGEPIPADADYNGDGVKGGLECAYPLADLNGSGVASAAAADKRMFAGKLRSDAEVFQFAWTGEAAVLQPALGELETKLAAKQGDQDLHCR